MAFLIGVSTAIVVVVALAAWYDHRARRRGEQVPLTLKRPWRGRM